MLDCKNIFNWPLWEELHHFGPDPLRSLIILLVPQPMSSTVKLVLFAKSYTSAKQGDD